MSGAWDDHYATEAGARHWPNEELVRWASGREFRHVLEVGAGSGGNAGFLAERCQVLSLIEPNERARQLIEGKGYGVAVGTAQNLLFHDGVFDLIIDCMTSQHIPWDDHEKVYREYARVLEPGGWLWIYHLDQGTVCDKIRDDESLSGHDWTHLSLFPSLDLFCLPYPSLLEMKVRAAGFEVQEVRGLARTYPNRDVASYTIVVGRKNEEREPR